MPAYGYADVIVQDFPPTKRKPVASFKGQLLIDSSSGALYQSTGQGTGHTWAHLGSISMDDIDPSEFADGSIPQIKVSGLVSDIAALQPITARPVSSYLALRAARVDVEPLVVVIAGHSVAAGSSATDATYQWPLQFSRDMQQAYPRAAQGEVEPRTLAAAVTTPPSGTGIQVIRAAVGSTKSDTYLTSTTRPQVASLNPAIIIHADLPANDDGAGTTRADFKANLLVQLNALDGAMTKPCLHVFTPAYVSESPSNSAPANDYISVFYELARERENVAILNSYTLWKLLNVGEGKLDILDYQAADLLHMNNIGHRAIAELLRTEFALKPRPFAQPSAFRRVSDGFSTDGAINGRAADLALSGTAGSWAASAAIFTTSGGLLQHSGASSGAAQIALADNQDVEISATLAAHPGTNTFAALDLYRGVTGNAYQFGINSSGLLWMGVSTPVVLQAFPHTPASLVGRRFALRFYAGDLYALLDGEILARVTPPTGVTRTSKGAGFASLGTGAGTVKWDNFVIDYLS